MRRPFTGSHLVTGDTATHAEYRVGPASDYAMPTGTPLHAIFAGDVATWWSGTGGNTTRISNQLDGLGSVRVFYQHQSEYAPTVEDGWASAGELVGYSGNTGSATTGPHLHAWAEVRGTRITLEQFVKLLGGTETALGSFTPASGTASGNPTPIPTRRKKKTMLLFHTDDAKAPRGIRFHIITADGGEAQFTSGETTFPNGVAGQLGNSVKTDRSLLDALKTQLKASAPAIIGGGTVTVDNTALVKAITDLGSKIDALPAEIDRLADGR